MKQLLTLLLLAATVTVKAQDTIKIPFTVAKQISKDLISCDSLRAELALTNQLVVLTEKKAILKDSIIVTHEKKELMYEQHIYNDQLKFDTQKVYVGELEKKVKKLKVKLLFVKITLGGIIGGLTYLYITK